jgi:hypothetical protein
MIRLFRIPVLAISVLVIMLQFGHTQYVTKKSKSKT